MTALYAACTTKVAETSPGPAGDVDALLDELGAITHDDAVRHFGPPPSGQCAQRGFAAERGDRAAFEEFIAEIGMPGDDRITMLGEWDRAEHPIAVVHWFAAPGLGPL